MKVICAGAPKTGTKSFAKALRILGYNPVYDVDEALSYAFEEWEDVWNEKQPDLNALMDTVYADVEAVVDVPHSCFFDHFFERWPDSKVVLLVRDSESWYKSYKQMVDRGWNNYGKHVNWLRYLSPTLRRFANWMTKVFEVAGGSNTPHSVIWKAWYKRHNSYVRATVPNSQLLEYNVAEGWKPLCEFLDKSVPQESFPFENRADDSFNSGDKLMRDTPIIKKAKIEIILLFTLIPSVLVAFLTWYFFY